VKYRIQSRRHYLTQLIEVSLRKDVENLGLAVGTTIDPYDVAGQICHTDLAGRVQSFCSQIRAVDEVRWDHWVLFPYDLAEFVSPWQGFQGGDSFFTGKREVADRKVTEIAGMSARGQSGDWALRVV
jgi:hypothetical protein